FIRLRTEGQIESVGWQFGLARIPPDGLANGCTIGEPESSVLLFLADPLRWTVMGNVGRAELHGRIPDAGLLQLVQFLNALKAQIAEVRLRIQTEGRLQLFGLEDAPRDLIDARPE